MEKIAVIGAGVIGGAIVKSLLKKGYQGRVIATRRDLEKLRELEKLGAYVTTDNRKAAGEADIIFLCVKPNDVERVLREISSEVEGKIVISTAATIPLQFYKQIAPKTKFVRTMPNIAAPDTGDLYVFWAGSPTSNHIYYRKYNASTGLWEPAVDWIDESEEVLTDNDRLTTFYNMLAGYLGLAYMTKTASPYNVKFAFLTPLIETIIAKDFPMNYLPTPIKAMQLTSKVSGATIIKVSQDYPLILLKKGKAEELRSKWT